MVATTSLQVNLGRVNRRVASIKATSPQPTTVASLLVGDLVVAETNDAQACPACGGRLFDLRGQLICSACRTHCESVSDGLPWNQASRGLAS